MAIGIVSGIWAAKAALQIVELRLGGLQARDAVNPVIAYVSALVV